MDDDAAIACYARNIPVDDSLLAPLGLVTWAAIRLHFTIRDTLGLYLGAGLSNLPFNSTLGGDITEHRLAQRLGTDHAHIAKLSLRLWQRTFSEERDRRAGADANQQKKGRISRELRAELERALTDGND